MPSRVRILLRNGRDGNFAHTGRHALKTLEELYAITCRQLLNDPFSGPTFSPPKPPPKDLKIQERVQWLWERIPPEWRKTVTLVITREPRNFNYGRSRANPRSYGWTPWQKRVRKSKVSFASLVFGDEPTGLDSVLKAAAEMPKSVGSKYQKKPPTPVPAKPKAEPKPSLKLGVWS